MHRKGYVTDLQRDAQAFAVQRSELDLQVAETAKNVLEKFTKAKTLVTLESTRDSAEAKMASEKAAFELEEDRLERLQTQLEKCTVDRARRRHGRVCQRSGAVAPRQQRRPRWSRKAR